MLRTIVACSNTYGGRILIGISNTGCIKGVSEKDSYHLLEYLPKMIYECVAPYVMPYVYLQKMDNKNVIVIVITAGINRPYCIKNLGLENGLFVRIGYHTLKASSEQLACMQWAARGISFDQSPDYMVPMHEVFEANTLKNNFEKLQADFLIFKEGDRLYPTKAATLIFSKSVERYYSEVFILCTHFKGTNGRDAIDSTDCTGSIFEQFNLAWDFIADNLKQGFTIIRRNFFSTSNRSK